jgi:hypothetical protein
MMKGRQTPRQQNRPRETGETGGIGDASMFQTAEKGFGVASNPVVW